MSTNSNEQWHTALFKDQGGDEYEAHFIAHHNMVDILPLNTTWTWSVMSLESFTRYLTDGSYILVDYIALEEAKPEGCVCDFRGPNAFLGCRCGFMLRTS